MKHGHLHGYLVEAGEELPTLTEPIVSTLTQTVSTFTADTTALGFNTDAKASTFCTELETPASTLSVKATAITLLLTVFVGIASFDTLLS